MRPATHPMYLTRAAASHLSNPDECFLHLLQLGRIPYAEGLRLQDEIVAARKAGAIGDTLLLMEHPPVLTLGRNATRANIVATDELLARKGAEVYETNRGGEVTYHGPGQLVGYPIFDLRGDLPNKRGPFLGPVDFVRLMEEALILTCKDFGVPAQRICKRTGVWTYAGGSIAGKEDRRYRHPRLAGHHLARLRAQCHNRPARLQLDRPLRHRRPRRHVARTRVAARSSADAGSRPPTASPRTLAESLTGRFSPRTLWTNSSLPHQPRWSANRTGRANARLTLV